MRKWPEAQVPLQSYLSLITLSKTTRNMINDETSETKPSHCSFTLLPYVKEYIDPSEVRSRQNPPLGSLCRHSMHD